MRVLVPTRDSASWISTIIDGYRALGLNVFFLVDERTRDETIAILRKAGQDHAVFTPSRDFVEFGMLQEGAKYIRDEWILRLDDDEFPCDQIAHLAEKELDPDCVYGLVRRETILMPPRMEPKLAQWPSLTARSGQAGRSVHYRLFNQNHVSFEEKLHTPGVISQRKDTLPAHYYTMHFNCIIRSPQQRLDKVRRYAEVERFVSYSVADESLPELQGPEAFVDVEDIRDVEACRVAHAMPRRTGAKPILTREEKKYIAQLHLRMGLSKNNLAFLPRPIQIKIAEFLGTLSKISGSDWMKAHSEAIWNHATTAVAPDLRR